MLTLVKNSLYRPNGCQARHLWRWLNVVFNRPDFDRINKVGPDRSCAEWLLKNGAKIAWFHSPEVVSNFNQLSKGTTGYLLNQVIAENSSISADGFIHFSGCKHIERIVFDECEYIDDFAIEELRFVMESPLQHLEIRACHSITDEGFKKMPPFKDLKTLELANLCGVERMLLCADHLQKTLPNTKLIINGKPWDESTSKSEK